MKKHAGGEDLMNLAKEKIIQEKDAKDRIVIETGKVFYVPLTWFLEEKAIYIRKADN